MKPISWLRQLWHWLVEIHIFWIVVITLALAICTPIYLFGPVADALRYAGLILQLLGVAVVAHTFRGRRKLFDRPSFFSLARNWILRAPRFRPRQITLEADCALNVTTFVKAEATVWHRSSSDQPVAEQLAAIQNNLEVLRFQLDQYGSRTNASIIDLRNNIEAEHALHFAELNKTSQTLKELGAESLNLEVAGITWLIFGIVLATISAELIYILQKVVQVLAGS